MKKEGQFSSEVAKAHGDNWTLWLGHLKGTPAQGLELGTWLGESAEWMLDTIFTHERSEYYCVDTFEGSEEHRLAGIDCSVCEGETRKRLDRFGGREIIHKARSDHAMKHFLRGFDFDFIYVDAAHDAMNVLRDSVLAWDLLKVGGVMIWDDYLWAVMADEAQRPRLAIDGFLACYSGRYEILGMGWQVAVKKLA